MHDLLDSARRLAGGLDALEFAAPVHTVYNALDYAWAGHEQYMSRYGGGKKKLLFLGMNPGPWGMAQTGVPFGEIAHVRDWMGIEVAMQKPANEHPKRPIEGFGCAKSEVSGRRLWGLFSQRYPRAEDFFAEHFVSNWCPLVWMEESGRNRTPDKLPKVEQQAVEALCDAYLAELLVAMEPAWAIGVGKFAMGALERVAKGRSELSQLTVGSILHPSPASPAANRGWAEAAQKRLEEYGLW